MKQKLEDRMRDLKISPNILKNPQTVNSGNSGNSGIVKLSISSKGDINFEGNMSQESMDALTEALDKASYYKKRTDELVHDKEALGLTSDLAAIVFGVLATLVVTVGVAVVVSNISGNSNNQIEVSLNVR